MSKPKSSLTFYKAFRKKHPSWAKDIERYESDKILTSRIKVYLKDGTVILYDGVEDFSQVIKQGNDYRARWKEKR